MWQVWKMIVFGTVSKGNGLLWMEMTGQMWQWLLYRNNWQPQGLKGSLNLCLTYSWHKVGSSGLRGTCLPLAAVINSGGTVILASQWDCWEDLEPTLSFSLLFEEKKKAHCSNWGQGSPENSNLKRIHRSLQLNKWHTVGGTVLLREKCCDSVGMALPATANSVFQKWLPTLPIRHSFLKCDPDVPPIEYWALCPWLWIKVHLCDCLIQGSAVEVKLYDIRGKIIKMSPSSTLLSWYIHS